MNLFLIDKSENVIGVVPDGKIIDLSQTLEINQADVLNGTITLDKNLNLDDIRYFAVPDRDNSHNLWMYRKTIVKVENDDIVIQGVNAFYDDLKAYGYIKDKRPNAINAEQAVRLVLGNTRWNVDFVDTALNGSNAEIHDTNFYYLTYLDAIKSIEEAWTVEIQPFINIEGNKITRKYVNLYKQMGSNNGKRFVYGKSALEIVKESNDTDVYTALIGRGAGVPEQDENGNDTGGYSRKITFADVEWSKAKGDPIDKPLGQEWIEWPQATKEFGYSDGTPRFGIVEFENEQDPANLLRETWEELQKSAIPAVQFSATVGDVGFLSLGETVSIIRYDLDIKYQTRVIKIDWNRKNEKTSQITLGDKLIQTAADRYRSVQAEAYKAHDAANQAKDAANIAITQSGTTVEWGPNEPAHPKEGDIWYDRQSDGKVVMKKYENGQWIILIDDTTGEQIKNKVDKAEKDVESLTNDVHDASASAEKALDNADKAIISAQNAATQSNNNTIEIGNVKGQLSTKVSSTDFESYKLQTDNLIQSKVSSTDFNSSITQINNAIQTKVSSADYQSKITQIDNAIATKVSSADFDSKITQISDSIDIKVTKGIDNTFGENRNYVLNSDKIVNLIGNNTDNQASNDSDSSNTFSLHKLLGLEGKKMTIQFDYEVIGNYSNPNVLLQFAFNSWYGLPVYVLGDPSKGHKQYTLDFDIKMAQDICLRLCGRVDAGTEIRVKNVKLEVGDEATKWTAAPEDLGITTDENVISQINVSKEGILISGEKVHITGQTVIDNASIKDANIASLSASKLTVGRIDCREIDVMNIAGYQIMANEITADKLAVNAILVGLNNSLTGMNIYPNGITIKNGGNLSFVMNQSGIHVSDPKNGEQVGWIHANSIVGADWYNGLVFDLEGNGDFMGWGVLNGSTNLYDLKFAYYRSSINGLLPGFHFSEDVHIDTLAAGHTSQAKVWTRTVKTQWGEDAFGIFSYKNSGIVIAADVVWLVFNNKYYNMNDVIHSIGKGVTWN